MGKGLAITSLVTGILPWFFLVLAYYFGTFFAVMAALSCITAIITGIMGIKRKQGGTAIAGLILGIVMFLPILFIGLVLLLATLTVY